MQRVRSQPDDARIRSLQRLVAQPRKLRFANEQSLPSRSATEDFTVQLWSIAGLRVRRDENPGRKCVVRMDRLLLTTRVISVSRTRLRAKGFVNLMVLMGFNFNSTLSDSGTTICSISWRPRQDLIAGVILQDCAQVGMQNTLAEWF